MDMRAVGVLIAVAVSIPAAAAEIGHERDTVYVLDNASVWAESAYGNRTAIRAVNIFDGYGELVTSSATCESILRLSPAVDVRERGAFGGQADLCIRGGSADQTMVLLNGIDFTDARTGHQSHSLPVDVESIYGIKLLEGVSGIGALSGAVDIQAGVGDSKFIRGEFAGGMYGYSFGSLSGACSGQYARVFASASMRGSEEYRHNTDLHNRNAYVRATSQALPIGELDFQAGIQDRKFGSNGFYAAYNPDQYEETGTFLSSIKWSAAVGRLGMSANASFRKNNDRYDWTRGTPTNYHTTDNWGAGGSLAYMWRNAVTRIDADWRRNSIFSSNLGDPLPDPVGPDGRYKCHKVRSMANVSLRHSQYMGIAAASAMGGVSFSPYGPAAIWDASFRVAASDRLTIDAGAGQSMRLPTFTDLYYKSKAQVNNLDLVPEKAVTFRAGAHWGRGGLFLDAEAYYRITRDRIAWVWRDVLEVDETRYASVWHSEQQSRLNTAGLELSGGWKRRGSAVNPLSLRSLMASFGYLDNDEISVQQTSTMLDYMKHKASLDAVFDLFGRFGLSATVSCFDRAGGYMRYDFGEDGLPIRDADGVMVTHPVDFEPYCLLDLNMDYNIGALRFYIDVRNAANTSYCDFGGVIMPGLWATAGVVVKIIP